jgi:putative colanic acid biosysnthesis UDP-glucose lipid carrier transferase
MRIKRLFEILLVLGELVVLNGAFFLALYLRFDQLEIANDQYYNYYLQLFFFLNSSWLLLTFITRSYELQPNLSVGKSAARLLLVFVSLGALLGLFFVLFKGDYSRLFFLYFSLILAVGMVAFRLGLLARYRRALAKPANQRQAVLLGSSPAAVAFVGAIDAGLQHGIKLSAWYAEEVLAHPRYLGNLSQADFTKADEVYVAIDSHDPRVVSWYRQAEKQMVRFRYLPSLGARFLQRGVWEQVQEIPVISMRAEPLAYRHNQLLKRATDVVGALVLILLLYPWLMPLLAIWIKWDSKGPIFFAQMRTGHNNKPFKIYKFRTLIDGVSNPEKQVLPGDARVTKAGAIFRKWSLDELPQLIQVLTGKMSLVGPRPHMLEHTEAYRRLIDGFMVRHYVKPGLTGWAQVQGYRGPTTPEDMRKRVEADVWYLENWSWWLDIQILWRTIFLMFNTK